MSNDPKPRNWTIDADPFLVENDEEVAQAFLEAMVILNRIGGAVVIAADREQISPDHWQTTGFMFRWTSFAPAKRIDPEDVPEPDAELVPAA